MKSTALCILVGLAMVGCQSPTPPTKPNLTQKADQNIAPDLKVDLKTPEPDDRFKALVIGSVFYLPDSDSQKFDLDEDKAKDELEKLSSTEPQSCSK